MAESIPTTLQPSPPQAETQIPTTVILRTPSVYNKVPEQTQISPQEWKAPPLEWLERTWTVTHSTLPMWRKAKNVRITYKLLPRASPTLPILIDDEVCSSPTEKTWMPQPKSIRGVDTPDESVPGGAAWNWRGRGWLKVASSHWEVLGWGEFVDQEGKRERWVVTWFAKSMFTPPGVDVYSERKEGVGGKLLEEIRRVVAEGAAGEEVRKLCEGEELRGVMIDDA
ncbi:hypothetical protein IFR04_013234 [Cadophora malorum]|uniref:Uncharacterized protein n=1 Tax=Cadophora malorum TaxID=108018 RepID=A0A8H7T701_9HELO|nr:hypothetical protein IFR04_013234 [Cadophora malorum]